MLVEYKFFTFTFSNTTAFNQPLNNWDTSSALGMSNMFRSTTATPVGFNQDIGSWDVSNVTDFRLFYDRENSCNFLCYQFRCYL
jgi:surface protein